MEVLLSQLLNEVLELFPLQDNSRVSETRTITKKNRVFIQEALITFELNTFPRILITLTPIKKRLFRTEEVRVKPWDQQLQVDILQPRKLNNRRGN